MLTRVDLSVVIVTYNSRPVIQDCLDSLALETAGMATQAFVVDSGSTDTAPDFIEEHYPSVTVIRQQNIGFSAGNNRALPLCTGDKVLLLNPDTILRQGSIAALMSALDHNPDLGAVGPTLEFPDGSIQDHCAHNLPTAWNMITWLFLLDKLEWNIRFGGRRTRSEVPPRATLLDGFTLLNWTRDRTTDIPYLSGACLMLRQQVLQRVGLLDDASPLYLDDLDYSRRIQDHGWKLRYVTEAVVVHLWQQSSAVQKRDADFYALLCHSVWIYLGKHEGRPTARLFSLAASLSGAMRAAVSTVAIRLTGTSGRAVWQRQQKMSIALLRWSLSRPKAPPFMNFVAAPALVLAGALPAEARVL